jgi:hypothetical protein
MSKSENWQESLVMLALFNVMFYKRKEIKFVNS